MAVQKQSNRALRAVVARFARATFGLPDVEELESRRLFCSLHDGGADDVDELPANSAVITNALNKHDKPGKVIDHTASWYKPARKIKIHAGKVKSTASTVLVQTEPPTVLTSSADVSYSTNAAGLPLLTSRADGKGLKVFLDFDGYNSDIPFSIDGDTTTFNQQEQSVIYKAWRDIVSFYSMLDVNVTTVQPATGGSNPAFVWQRITDSVSGGAAYVGAINNSSSMGWTDDSNAISRTSGIAHEIGHQLNLQHQSDWDNDADKTGEYTNGYSAHGSIIGIDYGQQVHKWWYGRNSLSADTLQDDLKTMSTYLVSKYGTGDGYMPDDYTGTTLATASPLPLVNGTYQATGSIERLNDADIFSFTSSGGLYNVNVEPTFEAGIAPRFEVYDSAGNLVAAKDDTSQRNLADNTNEQVTLNLSAGTYYVKVAGHGDYGDQGEYVLFASALPAGWNSTDISSSGAGRGGYVAYDPGSGTFTQGGAGGGIGSTSDAFHFTYESINGNGSVTARVTGLDNNNYSGSQLPLAGVMVRESLTAGARFAAMSFKNTGSSYSYRSTAGSSSSTTSLSLSMPNWVQLTRNGNVITLGQSTDGVSFNTVGTVTISSLASLIFLGLFTTSANTKQLANSTFTNVSATGTLNTPITTPNSLAAPANLTAVPVATQSTAVTLNWTDVTGETSYSIERSVDGVTWTQVATASANATAYTDPLSFGSMRWWYRISALDAVGKSAYSNVVSVINKPKAPANPQGVSINTTKLSLTWRDTSGDTGYRVEQSTDGGTTYTTLGTTAANIVGYNITGLTSATPYTYRITPLSSVGDGVPLVFSAAPALPAISGLAITSKTSNSVSLSWADLTSETGYRIERSTDNTNWSTAGTVAAGVTTFTDTAVSPLTHYYYRVFGTTSLTESMNGSVVFTATPAAAANPTPWVDADIGTPGGTGAGSVSGSTASVVGGGSNVGTGSSDQFNFLYRTLTGDGEIIARVASLDNFNTTLKAGVMMRETLSNNSKFANTVFQSTAGTLGTDFNYRAGTTAVAVDGTTSTSATYLRLSRVGNVFTSYYSTTGAAGSWTTIGSATISMASTVYVGLFASATNNSMLAKATFDTLSITPAALPKVSSMVINNGDAQRSRVTSMTVTFSQPVNLATNAISLWQQLTAGATATQITGYTLTPSAGNTVYTLTFPAGDSFPGGSLGDGLYELRVTAAAVTNTDGFAMAANVSTSTYRLAGDFDGSHSVDFNDFLQLQAAFGATAGSSNYSAGIDLDGNGAIDFNDFLVLQANFGKTL